MLPKVANTLIHHTHRAVVAVQNQTGHALRNALQSSSGSSTAVAGWGSPVSGGSSHSGPGPSKFHASGRLQSSHNGTPISSSQVRDRVEKLKAFRVPSAQHRSHLATDAAADSSQLVRSGFGTYATLINTLTDRDFENYEAVRRAEARLRRRRRAGLDENAHDEENRIASLRGDAHFKSALALFQTATSNPNSKFPLQIYNKLLRSCAIHANPHAASLVYAHLEKRTDIVPDAQTFISLIETYATGRDVQGAESMFNEFKEASRQDRVQWTCDGVASEQDLNQRASQTAVWNEMLAAYFRCGQATDALGLLEQMMDTSAGDTFRSAQTPLPTSSTFSRAIAGFCQNGDVPTALIWFERMLQQDTLSASPHESTRVPHRPDASTWTTMFDALADEGMVAELNRLFARWINISAQEGAAVWSDHRDSVLAANLKFMDSRADLEQAKAHELLDFLADHVLPWEIEGGHFTFYRDTSRSLCQRLVMQYWNRGHTDQALDLASRIATRQLEVIQHGQKERLFDATQSQRRIEGTRRFAADLTTEIMGKTGSASAPLSSLLRLSALLTDVGALVPSALSESCLNAYALQRASPTLSLTTKEWEALLEVVVASETDSSATLNTLVDDFLQHSADVAAFSDVAKNHLVRSLSWHDANSARLLAQFGEPFSSRYAELQRAQEEASSPAISAHSFDVQTPLEEVPGSPLLSVSSGRIDTAHSQSVGEFFPGGNKAAVLTAYRRFKSGADRGIYPRPIVLARLISALGRLGEVDKIYDIYDAAQVVLNSLETMKHWQTQGWFLIEDHMIIGLAHAGDLEAAHAHRQRILQQGGVPSADAYGALILHVKDTTDDTSNAMALFQESQSFGVVPNIFMYNTVISKLAKARKADYALQLFQDMKARGIQPTSVTYGAVIAACCRVGDAASAELLFQEMTGEPTFKPRVPPYNTMMQLYTHTKPDRARVLHYYNELLAARVQPTAHTYKLLIDAYGCIEPVDLPAMEKVFKDLVADSSVSVQGTHWAALINAYGCVHKDLDKALEVFDSIATHPSTNARTGPLPDAVVYEALINTLVTLRRMDLMPAYIERLQASGVHMTAYIANLLIKGYASVGEIERSREIFESLQDPQEGVAAPHNHVPHQNKQANTSQVPVNAPVYREPSTWEAMVRAELGNGERDRAVSLLQRLQARMFPPAVYQRISGIMLDDSVSPWASTDGSSSPSFST
ncbi:hypothetical protein L226DRAFT_617845 [Lentinus tigrinus ALCF2SS1-7]|uniref:Pentacotripeptide-repeat region of PRORP domain-containing protein n=1 Tax=Lentinus tigrinus ALCF2SS1-6 TaxID=1328759 RepID=A0A5C2RVV0_9APHY|nr:hypothetical protein L227DRAFT_657582 [Lentinus tigrinus ALCF2SS1-6]RPD67828.1 hypothetical protein L226DRAFT_617845 [Lentinus tigrinus ALCF2SS1-7]